MTPFVESPTDWPPTVRRYLAHLAVQKLLELHDGWFGCVEFLMRGRNGIGWNANVRSIWPTLVEEAEAFEQERVAKKVAG